MDLNFSHYDDEDIVARLRSVLHNDRSVELMNSEAADEIERLRRDYSCLCHEMRRMMEERNEARQEVCGLLVACHTDPDDDEPDPNLKHIHAGIRGWDCFKEDTDV